MTAAGGDGEEKEEEKLLEEEKPLDEKGGEKAQNGNKICRCLKRAVSLAVQQYFLLGMMLGIVLASLAPEIGAKVITRQQQQPQQQQQHQYVFTLPEWATPSGDTYLLRACPPNFLL